MRRAKRARCGISRRSRRRGLEVPLAQRGLRGVVSRRRAAAWPALSNRRNNRPHGVIFGKPTTREPAERTRPCPDTPSPRRQPHAASCSLPVKVRPGRPLRRRCPKPHRPPFRHRRPSRRSAAWVCRRAWPGRVTGAPVNARATAPSRSATDRNGGSATVLMRYCVSTRTLRCHLPPTSRSSVISIFPSIVAASICRSTSTGRVPSTRYVRVA